MKRLNILIWHVHGAYLYYLTQAPHEFYLPSKPDRKGYYVGKWGHIPWGENVHDVPIENLPGRKFDCIIYQRPAQYLEDQFEILSEEQRRAAKIYLLHDPPMEDPTENKFFLDDPNVLLVHVTPFNQLMWNCGRTPTMIIDHGVIVPKGIEYSGELTRGIVVVNNIKDRGRRLGCDIYERVREEIPLDLVGMGAQRVVGGLGEVLHQDLPAFEARYRFFFHPIRYTSLGLALVEAMMIGMPIVGLATTELVTVIKNYRTGYIDTRIPQLIDFMRLLIREPEEAKKMGAAARREASERFSITRFIQGWNKALLAVS